MSPFLTLPHLLPCLHLPHLHISPAISPTPIPISCPLPHLCSTSTCPLPQRPTPTPSPSPVSISHLVPTSPYSISYPLPPSLSHLHLSPAPASIPIPIPIPIPTLSPHLPCPISHPVPAALRAVPARPPLPGTVQGRHRALEAAQGGAASPSSIPAALKRRRRGRGAGTMSGRVGELSPRQAEALAQVRPAPGGRRGVLRCARLGRGVRGGPRAARRRDRGAITSGTRQQRDGGRRPAGHREARWHSFASPSTASIPRALLAPHSRHGARHTEVPQDVTSGCVPCLPAVMRGAVKPVPSHPPATVCFPLSEEVNSGFIYT